MLRDRLSSTFDDPSSASGRNATATSLFVALVALVRCLRPMRALLVVLALGGALTTSLVPEIARAPKHHVTAALEDGPPGVPDGAGDSVAAAARGDALDAIADFDQAADDHGLPGLEHEEEDEEDEHDEPLDELAAFASSAVHPRRRSGPGRGDALGDEPLRVSKGFASLHDRPPHA